MINSNLNIQLNIQLNFELKINFQMATKTNFQKVQEFNRAFDMVPKEPMNYDDTDAFLHIRPSLFTDEPKTIKLRLDLIDEEIKELNQAIKNEDFLETRDALADILYVVYGMADVLGINIDSYFSNHIKIGSKITEKLTNFNYIKNTHDGNSFIPDIDTIDILPMVQTAINICYKDLEMYCNYIKIIGVIENASNYNVNNNFEIIANHIYNILKWVYSYAYLSGINADADFAIVHDSNMSKLCDTEADAIITVGDYIEKYVAGTSPYDSPYYYELPELGKWIVKNKSSGKALKNIKYRKVDFTKQ